MRWSDEAFRYTVGYRLRLALSEFLCACAGWIKLSETSCIRV